MSLKPLTLLPESHFMLPDARRERRRKGVTGRSVAAATRRAYASLGVDASANCNAGKSEDVTLRLGAVTGNDSAVPGWTK